MSRPSRLTSGVLCSAVSLVLAATASLTGCSSPPFSTGENAYDVEEPVTALRIDSFNGDIEVVPGTGDTVEVVEAYEYTKGKPKVQHSVSGGELLLRNSGCDSALMYDKCGVAYRVEVPASTVLRLRTGGGDIHAENLSGNVHAEVGGGDVTLSFAAAPDSVDARSESGDVTVRLPRGSSYAVNATAEDGERTVEVGTAASSPNRVRVHSEFGDVRVVHVR
ncbi:DUF4097 family beta strand repeat-containing protein [Streptomyces sp. S6]